MRYIESPSHDAWFNMALEEYVFTALPRDAEYFMLWQNQNAVVVGRYQNTAEEIDSDFVRERGIQVVRRLTGGGAMYQDLGNLNFTFVVDQKHARQIDFDLFIEPVITALRQAGAPAERNSRNDIIIEGGKISGNSQCSRNGRILHHGTMLFDSDITVIGQALRPRDDKFQSKGVQSVRARVTNIRDHLPRGLTLADFKALLLQNLFADDLHSYVLTEADLRAIETLRTEKYSTWEWNYGRSPAYNRQSRRRYPFGTVEARLSVKDGLIADISLTGDFFGSGDLAPIFEKLRGCQLRRQALATALEGVDIGALIAGMDANMLADILEMAK